MASRKLEDLHPDIQPLAAALIKAGKKEGIDILIYCTYRSSQEQAELYAQGRTEPGPKVTWTLSSKHNEVDDVGRPASKAFDCVPIVKGNAVWNDYDLWEKIGFLGKSFGLRWGGDWKYRDCPHFEI